MNPEASSNSEGGLQSAKTNALAILNQGDIPGAVDAMTASLANDQSVSDAMRMLFAKTAIFLKNEKDPEKVRAVIEGFPE